jgi:hypothetical protein
VVDAPEYLRLLDGELEQLIAFSAESGEAIAGTFPLSHLIVSKTGEKTLRKLAEIRGIDLTQ